MKIDLTHEDYIVVGGSVYDAIENNRYGCDGCAFRECDSNCLILSEKNFFCTFFGKNERSVIFKKRAIEFDYDKIMQKDTAVHCDTEGKANNLLKWADGKGLKWNAGGKYTEGNSWEMYKKETCYSLFDGLYSDLPYLKNNSDEIYKYEDVVVNINKNGEAKMKYKGVKEITGKAIIGCPSYKCNEGLNKALKKIGYNEVI